VSTLVPKFKQPWVAVGPEEAAKLEKELSLELSLVHHLSLVDRRAVARRVDTDDVLFEINPHLCECVVVHLTWSGRAEMESGFPQAELFATFSDFVQERMTPDHQNCAGDFR
jgi:hypothetical protein